MNQPTHTPGPRTSADQIDRAEASDASASPEADTALNASNREPASPFRQPRWTHMSIARRVFVGITGGTLTLVGAIMLPLPPPFAFGIIILPAGLLILSTEFQWARGVLDLIIRKTGPLGRGMAAAERSATRLARKVLCKPTDDLPAPNTNAYEVETQTSSLAPSVASPAPGHRATDDRDAAA